MLKLLLAGLFDSHATIAGESIRALAFIFGSRPDLLTTDMWTIIKVTEARIQSRDIGYLTNLAFLYRELNRFPDLDNSFRVIISSVLKELSESQYANVRQEAVNI